MTDAERTLRYRFRIDAVVNYYDPLWNQFFGSDGVDTFFMGMPPGQRISLHPGELVRLTGEVVPSGSFRAEKLKIEVLRDSGAKSGLSAHGRLENRAALNERMVEIEGLVDWQEQLDPNHQRLSLISEGHRVNTTLCLNVAGQAPLLVGAVVHARGVYLGRVDLENHLQSIDLDVQGVENLRFLGWIDKDPRFELPAKRIADLQHASPGSMAHVSGRIASFVPGRSVTIRDDTGLLELRTPQERNLHIGAEVDAIGFRSADADPRLDQVLWRPHMGSTADNAIPSAKSVLNLAAEVMELPAERAAAGQPVQLSGVITWAAEGASFFFIQDKSGGVRVDFDPKKNFGTFSSGAGIAVRGVSAMGEFAPEVIAQKVDDWSAMSAPEPVRLSLEQAQTGTNEARWAEMEGYVRGVSHAGQWTQLNLTTDTGEFQALLIPTTTVDDKVGAFVRIRGVCDAISNEFHRSTGVRLWVPLEFPISIDEAPVSDLYSIPFTPLDSFGRFGPQQGATHWLHTGGTVTYDSGSRFLTIQTGRVSLMVLNRDKTAFAPGDQVDVVGIPGWNATRFVLREAVARKNGFNPDIRAVTLGTPIPLNRSIDSRLVKLSGLLTDVNDLGEEYYLTIRNGTEDIIARISHPRGSSPPEAWKRGSSVTATGVYLLRFDENRDPTGMELRLRVPSDLVITKTPPWWTVARALAAAGVLGTGVFIVALWVVSLRRRVRKQTEQIRLHMESHASLEAELERSQRLRSLGLLAGGIAHDFNNQLTVIMGNIALALLDNVAAARVGDCLRDAEAGSRRAQGLTQQLLTFAKGGDPVRQPLSLATVAQSAATLALSGARSRLDFKLPPNLWSVYADPGQLGRAIQNLVAYANAAMPNGGVIDLNASNETVGESVPRPFAPGNYVWLTVADHGQGIPSEQLPGIFDPYGAAELGKEQFGLATSYSIAKKHGGFLEVNSKAGFGTTFKLWIPAAEDLAGGHIPAQKSESAP